MKPTHHAIFRVSVTMVVIFSNTMPSEHYKGTLLQS